MAIGIGKTGSTAIFNQMMYTIRIYCFNQIMLGLAGTIGIAALALVTTLADLLYCIALGAGSVTLMLSSMFYGEEDRHSLEELVHVMISHSFAVMAGAVVVFESGAEWIMRLFLGDKPNVLALAVPDLRLYLLSLLISVLNAAFKNYFQGIRHIRITYLISFLESVGSTSLFAFLFSKVFGLTGFWLGVTSGQFLTFTVISAMMWKKYGKISFTKEAYSFLERDFGASASDCVNLSIEDASSAVKASEQVYRFCCSKTAERRTATLLSLCVEEIANNILQHGFTKDNRSHHLDIRLVAREGKWVLRFRDDCAHFDPLYYLELHKSEDSVAHIGLRMVMGMVEEANYVNSLGLNHLTLTVVR
jgi:anti-sigma regulatory factor (Ser/Thr protein kinase)